jgi:hypothetical protein
MGKMRDVYVFGKDASVYCCVSLKCCETCIGSSSVTTNLITKRRIPVSLYRTAPRKGDCRDAAYYPK